MTARQRRWLLLVMVVRLEANAAFKDRIHVIYFCLNSFWVEIKLNLSFININKIY